MKPLPTGESNYESLITNGYYYVDKTMYIERLEKINNRKQMLLRPRKFGKSLFVSTLSNYYDILKRDKFDELFGNTYIGKQPTNLRNSYYILNFDFSGIDTSSVENTIKGFKIKVKFGITNFVNAYKLDFIINDESEPEEMLLNLFGAFINQRIGEKIYVLIDEYDQFANELLGLNMDNFKKLLTENGKVRKWYEVLKQGCSSVVDRVFMTGVAPITLDSLTSGFNIATDLTRDMEFNEIFGFTEEELKNIMNEIEIDENKQAEILPIMKEYYDGYKFSIYGKENMYNSNMCLYFLDLYSRFEKIPNEMMDVNIASDFSKLDGMLNLCREKGRQNIIEDSIAGNPIISEITKKFNPKTEFDRQDLISILFYLGYLTIVGDAKGKAELKIPNLAMKELYAEYFLNALKEETKIYKTDVDFAKIADEVLDEGRIDKITEIAGEYLNKLSNRDFISFNEENIKVIFFCIVQGAKESIIAQTEGEYQRRYVDLFLKPNPRYADNSYSILIEFKYLKKKEEGSIKEKQNEARKQILEYKELDEMKKIERLRAYTVVAVNDKLYVEEV